MDAQSITQIHPRGLSLFDPFPIRPSFFSFTLRRTLRQFFRLEFLFRPTISPNLQEILSLMLTLIFRQSIITEGQQGCWRQWRKHDTAGLYA